MIEFLKQLPHLEPYGTPVYFIYLIGALLPINSIEASVITSGSFTFTLSWSFCPWFL